MENKTLLRITFVSFVKIIGSAFLMFGLAIGILMLIFSFFDDKVVAYLGTWQFNGVLAGFIGLFTTPIGFWVVGFLMAAIMFWPFQLFLKLIDGIKLNGIWR